MDIDEIKTLTDLMVETGLTEIMVRDGEKRIVLRRGLQNHSPFHAPHMAPPAFVAPTHAASPHGLASEAAPAKAEEVGIARITSPMVGTFYSAPAQDAAPFVKVGDTVGVDTVVCIIEAMKVFNEIKADVAGVIESIEVTSGTPVEYGQLLMKVRTA